MASHRHSTDAARPTPSAAPASPAAAPVHPAFAVVGRDAFRDKAERDARKRAEQAERRKTPAASVAAPPKPIPEPKSAPKSQPATPSDAPSQPKGPSAAIIPWPVRERVQVRPARPPSPTRAPVAELPRIERAKPQTDPKRAPAVAPFAAAEFWRQKPRPGGGGGEGGGSGPTDGKPANDRSGRARLALIMIVLLILALIGWIAAIVLGKTPKQEPVLQPRAAVATPPLAPPAVRPDPFPAGPIDLKPTSPMPQTALAEPAPSPAPAPEPEPALAPVAPLPVVVAQAAPSPPTPAAAPVSATCTPGRMVHAYFCTARSDLTPAARQALDAELDQWRSCIAGQELVVKGYADTRGSQAINIALGESRAKQLADILRAQGLKVAAVVGVGQLDGLAPGQNCLNQRRVDIGLRAEIDAATPSRACAPPKEIAPITCGPAVKADAGAVSPAR